MPLPQPLILTRRDVAALFRLEDCIQAVEQAFRLFGEGKTAPPGVLAVHASGGAFHIKAGVLQLDRLYFAAKTNANFPENPARRALPTIQGVIVLSDAESGSTLAIMDSIEITILRTGAATAVAAKYLALSDASVATICGCGVQGRVQLRALAAVRPLARVYAVDADPAVAQRFASELSAELGIDVVADRDLVKAVRASQICVTCTTSRIPILHAGDVTAGTFVAAVGADNPEKQELDAGLMAQHTIVADVLEQAATIGDLHHAIEAGKRKRSDVYAELGEVVAGRKVGRRAAEEVIIFDSTGMALQDVAAAAAVYQRAVATGTGLPIDLSGK